MTQAALVAREAGCFSFDRLERGVLAIPESWIPSGLSKANFQTKLTPYRLESGKLWPFRQECPIGDFGLNEGPKWWTHGQIHALVGGAWWPKMSEWELMHMARLSEALASWHWYWLSELERQYCPIHSVTSADQTPDCDACRALEQDATHASVRRERLQSDEALVKADNSLAFLRYEAHCYQEGLTSGELVVPKQPYLSMGEACDYARHHRRRLMSSAHQRWLETCLSPDVDYATSTKAFGQHVAKVTRSLTEVVTPSEDVSQKRARRVLQDLAARVCQAAELVGKGTHGFQEAINALSEGLNALPARNSEREVDEVLGSVLERVCADLEHAPELATTVLSLGYRPTRDPQLEPRLIKEARSQALMRRLKLLNSPLHPLLNAHKALRERVIARPRSSSPLDDCAASAEEHAQDAPKESVLAAFVGWLQVAREYQGFDAAREEQETPWYYRLALPRLGPEAMWSELRLRPNPYLTALPSPFSVTWLERLSSEDPGQASQALPQATSQVAYVLIGKGRSKALFLPWTEERKRLLNRLQHTPSVRELIDEGFSLASLDKAIKEELVILLQSAEAATLSAKASESIESRERGSALAPHLEDPGPWQAEEQASYYERFCATHDLYERLSEALVALADLAPHHKVVDLGCGTGITSQAILKKLGPEGKLLAIDPAPRMVSAAKAKVNDARVRFDTGTARRMLQLGGPVDRVISNSAIWLDQNILVPPKASEIILEEGGRLCFSIPAEYLGHHAHWTQNIGRKVARTLEHARVSALGEHEGGKPLITPPHQEYLGSVERMSDILLELGYKEVDAHLFKHSWPLGAYIDWIAQPVSLQHFCPGDTASQARFLKTLKKELNAAEVFETHWFLVVAKT